MILHNYLHPALRQGNTKASFGISQPLTPGGLAVTDTLLIHRHLKEQ